MNEHIDEEMVRIFYAYLVEVKGKKLYYELFVRAVKISFSRKELA